MLTQNDPGAPPSTNSDRCPDCGAPVAGGRAGCQSRFDELTVQAYHDRRYAALRDLVVDSYCMQHPETYCRSAKSYAAHLTRLCCGLEFGGQPNIYAAIQKWVSGPVAVERPVTLSSRGQLTLLHVRAVPGVEAYETRVREWAASVWQAYAVQHDLARVWLRTALGVKDV